MIARRAAFAVLHCLRHGRIEVIEGRRRRTFGPAGAPLAVTMRVHSPAVWRALLRGSLGVADSYVAGQWDCDDLVTLARIGALEMPRLDRWRRPLLPFKRLLARARENSRVESRQQIAAHYDRGNDLFSLFLDETMTYSAAVFESPQATLREAQEAKLDLVCRKLDLTEDDHLLEIGTGWGSLALHAASRYGCRVTTTTISPSQFAYARQAVAAAGLDDRVTVLHQDYRDLGGRYDKLASIEMIEAVGWRNFELYFARCAQLLAPGGRMLVQAIVIDDRAYEVEKTPSSFANTHVFPGGCLPSLEVIERCVRAVTDMHTLDVHDITEHYATTLRHWRERFRVNVARVPRLRDDVGLRRLWELYLSWSEGGFRERRIRDVQILLARPAGAHASNGAGRAVVGAKRASQPASRASRVQIDV